MKIQASAIAFLLVLLLAGCMGTASDPQPTVLPTLLHVVRPSLVGYHQAVASLDRTVREAAALQRLYAGALALPRQHVHPCPNDFGLPFDLPERNEPTPTDGCATFGLPLGFPGSSR